ncbi:HNH endonuclease signature motif containing protein [Myxococcus stipitatus]|uniref:HNH endonuclease n=1 Tax=Myxococcus stipitatus TaxID=83455 RepID=UPI0030CA6524
MASYFSMLAQHQTGQAFNKAAERRLLLAGPLSARTNGSIEFKFQNISHILHEMGRPWLEGYAPGRGSYAAPLKLEVERVLQLELSALAEPTAERDVLEERTVRILKSGPVPRPAGHAVPRTTEILGQRVFLRDSQVRAFVLQEANGHCDACRGPAPFMTADGVPYLEVHHVRLLAKGGSDRPENTVALCPNCHRRLHLGRDAAEVRERLYAQVTRLIRE